MNKNLGLLALLSSLLAITFYFEEIKRPERESSIVEQKRLISNKFNFSKITLPKATLVFDKKWSVKDLDYRASVRRVSDLTKIISGIQVLNELPQNIEKDVFQKNKLAFSISGPIKTYKIILGDVSDISGHFYLKANDKIYVVEDSTAFTDVYSSELDLKLKKYLRLKKMIEAPSNFYIERKLFINELSSKLKFAKIDSKRNRWYSFDFDKETLIPPPFKGVELVKLQAALKIYLNRVNIKSLVQGNQNILTNLVSEIAIGSSDKTVVAKLYMGNNGQYGRYVKLSSTEQLFEIEEKGSEIFFQPDQSFWKKKFQLPQEIYSSKSFNFALSTDQEVYYLFKVEDVKEFKVSIADPKIKTFDKNLMNFTFNLLLNASLFEEANLISRVGSAQDFLKDGFVVSLKIFKKLFHIVINGANIRVLDESLGLVYHFSGQNTQVTSQSYQRIFTPYKN